ncbi:MULTISPECIES: twin-arginine translocase subunit TatC [Nosocomiicoccus]|uniref:Sec-independent protein translocase protein TatC n=1 Tax=Nosocomiicoccus massiliensis TaxID=1232430 RepID=A0AAF0YPF3_9STAP|nr:MULTISPECIES: twin-arginine translocase subunit TatC [Nosocomiicoccus]MDK6863236.1 twin-arginine translocase subunit TatC [Nosocomiicoccus ampullae]OFL46749.1 preprotein translocase subunit TatC [Nosocomiicoccus sp. HMSC067E10]OFO56454.1 preprotein translocase subunit TatC [Nosocomiicoccus sp. HMSC059G07]OFS61858.1 preprotein translocase subunit TatC [Nosocomiicoccus sp. HMSC09A07]WOS96962.1 twin-arginine translocase subunit TatC [Nosocomiicoccus massiliensis]
MQEKKEIIEHVQELRKRVLFVTYFFVAALLIGFYFAKPLVHYLQNAPWLEMTEMHAFNVTDPLRIYLTMIVIIAFILVLPVILYQFWAFVSPGLYEKERQVTLIYIPIAFILMIIGMVFSYFIVVPYIVKFTFSLSVEMGIVTTIGINDYFGFLVRTVLPFGIIFQMPILVLFMTQLGIITPMFLKKNRKYAYFILFVLAAIIAPPDVMTHFLLTLPMILLYEISITVSKVGYRRYLKAEEQALKETLKGDE